MKAIFLLNFFIVLLATPFFAQTETGIASYYSDQLHGKLTASGEAYDKGKLTAAHRTLPFGTMVTVTRIDNGKSVQVRINDRGPFSVARVIDVSRKAAETLGLVQSGTTRVKIEVIKKSKNQRSVAIDETGPGASEIKNSLAPEKPPKYTTSEKPNSISYSVSASAFPEAGMNHPSSDLFKIQMLPTENLGYGVQLGSFGDFDNALKKVADLQKDWFRNILVKRSENSNGGEILKIILGPLPNRNAAEVYLSELKGKGIAGFIVNLQELQ